MHDVPENAHTVLLTTVAASIEECYAVAIDLEAYPEWVRGVTAVEVTDRDDEERPRRARFEATAVGRRSSYELAYDLSKAPNQLSWSLIDGDLTRRLEGAYIFEPSSTAAGPEATDVTWELLVDLTVSIPGFVQRRAEDKIVEAAMQRFADRVLAMQQQP